MASYSDAIVLYSPKHAYEKLLLKYKLQENPRVRKFNYFFRSRSEFDGRCRNERTRNLHQICIIVHALLGIRCNLAFNKRISGTNTAFQLRVAKQENSRWDHDCYALSHAHCLRGVLPLG